MYGLFTFMNGEKWPHSRGNVGKYYLHGSYGNCIRVTHPKAPQPHAPRMIVDVLGTGNNEGLGVKYWLSQEVRKRLGY